MTGNHPRKIKQIIEPQMVIEGAGVLLRRSFGPSRLNLFDPFLLFDHFAFNDPREGPIRGFPTHPHRGIETVTYILEGNVRHRDSLGNAGVIGAGDAQWMTSGRGILHEEMPQRGPNGVIYGFQLWVNLPRAKKMSQPRYQEITAGDIPAVDNDGARIRLVAGEYAGVRGPVTEIAANPVYMDVTLEPGAAVSLPAPLGHAAIAYLFEGEALFGTEGDEQLVPSVHMLVFEDGEGVRAQAAPDAPARFMLMAGAPFNEPVVPYGPFVMNTQEEIQQALMDLRNGTFVQN
jgi:redox-sensitive bicupin YhaK (pirin superfamily)